MRPQTHPVRGLVAVVDGGFIVVVETPAVRQAVPSLTPTTVPNVMLMTTSKSEQEDSLAAVGRGLELGVLQEAAVRRMGLMAGLRLGAPSVAGGNAWHTLSSTCTLPSRKWRSLFVYMRFELVDFDQWELAILSTPWVKYMMINSCLLYCSVLSPHHTI